MPIETMETVRLFSHASDVQTGYLLITVGVVSLLQLLAGQQRGNSVQ